jgi:uncharacterized membrane protein (DUF485 family)
MGDHSRRREEGAVTTTETARDDDGAGGAGGTGGASGTPGAVRAAGTAPGAGTLTYAEVHDSDEFRELRRRFRRFVFPTTVFFLAWYFLYVCLAAWAPGFMGTRVVGKINIGLLFGLGQFVSTFTITVIYVRWADRRLDASADRLREAIEGGDLHESAAPAEPGHADPAARTPAGAGAGAGPSASTAGTAGDPVGNSERSEAR